MNDRLISELQKENLPWRKEWSGSYSGDEVGIFFNYRTKKPYRGVNPWLIMMDLKPHHCNFFLTKSQIESAGGTINKGAKKFLIVYNGKAKKEIEFQPTEENPEGGKMFQYIRFLRDYYVYNLADTDLTSWKNHIPKPKPEAEKIEACEKVYELMPNRPKLNHGGDEAFYLPGKDQVQMPKLSDFTKPQFYYCTLFHELIHSTGHAKRIARDLTGSFGNKSYAFEELIAEIGASYICGHTGIFFATKINSGSYLRSWCKKLVTEANENKTFFFKAASESQKAANYILSKQLEAQKTKAKKKPKTVGVKTSLGKVDQDVKQTKIPEAQLPVPPIVATKSPEVIKQKLQETVYSRFKKSDQLSSAGTFRLPGDLGELLGDLGKVHCSITLEGDMGAGKSQLAWQMADAFIDLGMRVAIFCPEMLESSPTVTYYRDTYIKPENRSKLLFNDEQITAEEIGKLSSEYDVAIIDSFNEIPDYDQTQFGKLFKKYEDKVFIGLFQSHSGGEIRGGVKPLSDACGIL